MDALPVPNLHPGAVHIWPIDLDLAGMFDFLSTDERARALRFKFDRDRIRFETGRNVLRLLLGSYLNKPPRSIHFNYGPAGKPNTDGLSFNLAHSGRHGLIAIAAQGLLGVDIEEARALPDLDTLATQVFSPGELHRWRNLPASDDRTAAFYRIWTRKEAYLKAIGEGIAHRLQKFEVAFEPEEPPKILSGAEGVWSINDISPSPSLIAAVACEGPNITADLHQLSIA